MTDPQRDDALWQDAIGWVMRQHECSDGTDGHAGLSDWLIQDPACRAAYDRAAFLLLLTGLILAGDQAVYQRMENKTR